MTPAQALLLIIRAFPGCKVLTVARSVKDEVEMIVRSENK